MSRIRRATLEIDEESTRVSCTFTTCCVSWVEMREAVIQFRDKLNEEIANGAKCPFSPERAEGAQQAVALLHQIAKAIHFDADVFDGLPAAVALDHGRCDNCEGARS